MLLNDLGSIYYDYFKQSYQLTIACRFFGFRAKSTDHWCIFAAIKYLSDWIFKDVLEALSCQSAAFLIQAINSSKLLLYFALWHWCALSWLRWSQIYFISNEDKKCPRNNSMNLIIPLNHIISTLLMALVSVDFSATEKVIKKISVLGYASGLNLAYSSWPAVSLI